jgi:hypothetical protein
MHTIVAATLRSILIKIGIENFAIHILFGLTTSFIGPIIIAWLMNKVLFLNFFIYPTRYIKTSTSKLLM